MWEESDIPSQQEEEENKYVRTDGRTVNLQHKLELESQREWCAIFGANINTDICEQEFQYEYTGGYVQWSL